MSKALEIAGQRFGRLVAKQRIVAPGSHSAMWECVCDCGGITLAVANSLGKTKFSCGCLRSETAARIIRNNRLARKHLHGKSNTVEWRVWSKMKDRCSNSNYPKYHRYGGRGITVCQRWLDSFENFLDDMGTRPSPRHSLDRENNDGNYEPSNCRWATPSVQFRNTSKTQLITIDGITLCATDWIAHLNIPRWKPYEMIRKTGARRDKPAKFASIEVAIKHLHAKTLA